MFDFIDIKLAGSTLLHLPLRGIILHKMFPKDVFEGVYCPLLYYAEKVSDENNDIFILTFIYYLWLKQHFNTYPLQFD